MSKINFHNTDCMEFMKDICELDKEYFDAAVKRFDNHIKQLNLF